MWLAKADGSGAKLMTPPTPSYFHGWSPDGKWLAFVGQRDGKYELFRVAASGGAEERLTSKGAYDDGPEYTIDGKWIYFNSDRSGDWDIWRIPAEGGGPGRRQSRAGHQRRTGGLVPALLARRQVDAGLLFPQGHHRRITTRWKASSCGLCPRPATN